MFAVAISFREEPPFQVVGYLASNDIREVRRVTRHEMMSYLMPYVEWNLECVVYYGRRPKELLRDIKHYRARKILWGEVHTDGSVEVFVGTSKNAIMKEGYSVTCRKQQGKWTGFFSMWSGGPSMVTTNIHIPPDP
jgi:hypothetical protein